MKFRVDYKGKSKTLNSAEDVLVHLALTDADSEVVIEVGKWCADVDGDMEHGHMFDWRGVHVETVRPVKPEPPRPEKPKGPTEFILEKLYPETGWCLFKLVGKTENSANEELARAQGLDPFGVYRVKEVVSAECWWNDSFLAN